MIQSILPQNIKRPIKVDGRVIGWLANGIFYKSVTGSQHMLRSPRAWAIDANSFDRDIKPNATKIVVNDKETGIEYHTSVETFARNSFRFNRGFGTQYALPLQYFQTNDNRHEQLNLWRGDGSGF